MKCVHVALWVAVFMLAGCSTAPAGVGGSAAHWDPLSCDSSGATTIGRNAPQIVGLRGTDFAIAGRVAAAFGDEITSTTPIDSTEDFARWSTSTGYVQVSGMEGPGSWDLTTSRGDYPSEKRLHAGLVMLGAPVSSLETDSAGSIQQVWQGQRLSGVSAGFIKGQGDPAPMGWYGSFSLAGFVVPPGPLETVAESEILATARGYDRCAMDAGGRTAAAGYAVTSIDLGDYGVQHDSLVRHVFIQYTEPGEPGHCGFSRGVAVDAVTGAVHGPVPVMCA